MKIFISADIEGINGVTAWSETVYGGKGYEAACQQMSLETAAACRAAIAAGYKVVVKDGHEDARNIDANLLPRGVELIRGWMKSPYGMMAGIDETYAGAIYIGYHARGYSDASPLKHTIEEPLYNWIKLNGRMASEFTLNSMLIDELGVPSLFLSGDQGICDEAKEEYPGLVTFATKKGVADATWNIHPEDAIEGIEKGVAEALANKAKLRPLQQSYTLEINYKDHQRARNASWYPGVKLIDGFTVSFTAKTPWEIGVAINFIG